jgi:acetyl-CoA carboxylase carboxyl transferase subunit beta
MLTSRLTLPGKFEPVSRDQVAALEQRLAALEENLDLARTPMDKVRIVRHPQHLCLKDILENVYDNYTEIGGRGEVNIDPGMCIARAYLTRRVGNKVMNQPVMVVGQEKGHGEEFRNGGSIKPWGNSKALKYMKVAALETIPIHTFVFTPGSSPSAAVPGAASCSPTATTRSSRPRARRPSRAASSPASAPRPNSSSGAPGPSRSRPRTT